VAPQQRTLSTGFSFTRPNFVLQATRLVTASDDDSSPVILVWDLRNANAPEKVYICLY